MRGLDPYAAPIVGTANVIMQGLGAIEDRKHREEDRAWNRQVQERQQKEWELQDRDREEQRQVDEVFANFVMPPTQTTQKGGALGSSNMTPVPTDRNQINFQEAINHNQLMNLGEDELNQVREQSIQGASQRIPYISNPQVSQELYDTVKSLPPSAQVALHKRILNHEREIRQNDIEAIQAVDTKLEYHRRRGQDAAAKADIALKSGRMDEALHWLQVAENHHYDGGNMHMGEDGGVVFRNAFTNEETPIDIDLNDPNQVKQAIDFYSQAFVPGEEYFERARLHSETQFQYNQEAFENPTPYIREDGAVIYGVRLIDPESQQIVNKYYDIPTPYEGAPELHISHEQLSQFTPMDVADTWSKISGRQAKGDRELTSWENQKMPERLAALTEQYGFFNNPREATTTLMGVYEHLRLVEGLNPLTAERIIRANLDEALQEGSPFRETIKKRWGRDIEEVNELAILDGLKKHILGQTGGGTEELITDTEEISSIVNSMSKEEFLETYRDDQPEDELIALYNQFREKETPPASQPGAQPTSEDRPFWEWETTPQTAPVSTEPINLKESPKPGLGRAWENYQDNRAVGSRYDAETKDRQSEFIKDIPRELGKKALYSPWSGMEVGQQGLLARKTKQLGRDIQEFSSTRYGDNRTGLIEGWREARNNSPEVSLADMNLGDIVVDMDRQEQAPGDVSGELFSAYLSSLDDESLKTIAGAYGDMDTAAGAFKRWAMSRYEDPASVPAMYAMYEFISLTEMWSGPEIYRFNPPSSRSPRLSNRQMDYMVQNYRTEQGRPQPPGLGR